MSFTESPIWSSWVRAMRGEELLCSRIPISIVEERVDPVPCFVYTNAFICEYGQCKSFFPCISNAILCVTL